MHIDINDFYKHQIEYYNKLVSLNGQVFRSIICIPTGGGKTRLAVSYLINNVLNDRKKVLWITHSKYLLNQAYITFYKLLGKQDFDLYKPILIHSDNYLEINDNDGRLDCIIIKKINDLSSENRVVFISFQSLQRSKIDWESIIGKDTVVVIDEAHHAVADKYFDVIKNYTKDKITLGLTATPIRTKKSESDDIGRYFNTDLGIKVHIANLFKENLLVKPVIRDVQFDIGNNNIDGITDVNEALLNNLSNYNNLIFDEYESNEKEYGKTVIFAINKDHVEKLYELFNTKYSGRVYKLYSEMSGNREQEFKDFQNSKNGILININILNEGVDIPDIKTVFMTKPLDSKITVTQIIGRALRKSPNKTHANIINFAVNNVGRKFLIVSPKIAYQYYDAMWNDSNKIDTIDIQQKSIDMLVQLIDDNIKKKATCSFSNVFLAGQYNIIDGDGKDVPIPVTFKEYRKIEKYINLVKNNKKCEFIKKMYFYENADILKQYIDSSIDNDNVNDKIVMFEKYDDELYDQYNIFYDKVKQFREDMVRNNMKQKEIDKSIEDIYNNMRNDMKNNGELIYHLSQIGANTIKQFKSLFKTELVNIKYENA